MMFSLIILYRRARNGHSKREVLEIFNLNQKNVISLFLFLNNLRFLAKWPSDISRDLLTLCLYFKMLRTIIFLCVPSFDSAPSSMLKLQWKINFPQVNPQSQALNYLSKKVTEQCAKANKPVGFVHGASRYIQSTQTRRTLYLSIARCHLGYRTQVWSPQSIGLKKRVENVQRRASKLILKPSFSCDVTSKTRLRLTNLLPISFWHEFLDIVFFYKVVNNLVLKDSEALPATRQSTRSTGSSSSNTITYISKRSRTVTYQRSFFIRACRTWNVLRAELRTSHISLASFKRSLFQYYNKALDLYNVDDIRTWRTICPRCNIARTLLCPPTCCSQQFELPSCFLLIFLLYRSVAFISCHFHFIFAIHQKYNNSIHLQVVMARKPIQKPRAYELQAFWSYKGTSC